MEVQAIYGDDIRVWAENSIRQTDRSLLIQALAAGDCEPAENFIPRSYTTQSAAFTWVTIASFSLSFWEITATAFGMTFYEKMKNPISWWPSTQKEVTGSLWEKKEEIKKRGIIFWKKSKKLKKVLHFPTLFGKKGGAFWLETV